MRIPAVLLVVGHGPNDLDTPPREWTGEDPVWTSPDGMVPHMCLHNNSYDVWYWHVSTQTHLRIAQGEQFVFRAFEPEIRWCDTAGAQRHGPLTAQDTF